MTPLMIYIADVDKYSTEVVDQINEVGNIDLNLEVHTNKRPESFKFLSKSRSSDRGNLKSE